MTWTNEQLAKAMQEMAKEQFQTNALIMDALDKLVEQVTILKMRVKKLEIKQAEQEKFFTPKLMM